jgi:adenylyltransferase/sulfurtransferase
MRFSPEQIERYSRQMLLREVGGPGQQKLLSSRVLIIGLGGLGSPAALYLAAAGVGTLGLVDFDAVDLSNLQRQLLHTTDDVGLAKVDSAHKSLTALNPDVKLIAHREKLSSDNAIKFIENYDLVVDGSDNFPTRYLVNDACVFLKKPNVFGSVLRFEGQATVFLPTGPCYRCLFPKPPAPGTVPSCAEAGVLGTVTGLVGALQANEALKLLLGLEPTLISKLLLIDTLNLRFEEIAVKKNPNCPVCSMSPTITKLIDYEEFCKTVQQ